MIHIFHAMSSPDQMVYSPTLFHLCIIRGHRVVLHVIHKSESDYYEADYHFVLTPEETAPMLCTCITYSSTFPDRLKLGGAILPITDVVDIVNHHIYFYRYSNVDVNIKLYELDYNFYGNNKVKTDELTNLIEEANKKDMNKPPVMIMEDDEMVRAVNTVHKRITHIQKEVEKRRYAPPVMEKEDIFACFEK